MQIDDLEIDADRYELRRDGVVVAVEPKVFDLIVFLARNANRLVTKDEMIKAVWDGRIVSDAALSSAIKSARRAMGASSPKSSRIKTVHGRGFRMEITEADIAATAPPAEDAVASRSAIYVQPGFMVLQPQGLSADHASQLQRGVSRAMSRLPFLSVAAPAIARRMENASPADLLASLGPGFALDISARTTSDAIFLDCLLFEYGSGRTIWSYEVSFPPDDGITRALNDIVVRLQPQLMREIHAALAGPGAGADARALTLQALGTMSLKGWNRTSFGEAEGKLRQALQMDSSLAFTHSALALVMALGQDIGLIEPSEARRSEAVSHADRAIELDGLSPPVLGLAGCALCDAGQGMRGKIILQRALNIDPDDPQALAALGTQHFREHEVDQAITCLQRAIEASPQDTSLAVWRSILALALLRAGQVDKALSEARQAVMADDNTHLSRTVWAVTHIVRKELDQARQAWADARRVTPDLTTEQVASFVGKRLSGELAKLETQHSSL